MTLRKCLHTGSSEDNYKQALFISVISYFIPATCQVAQVSCCQGWPPVTLVQLNATLANDCVRGLCRAWLLYLRLWYSCYQILWVPAGWVLHQPTPVAAQQPQSQRYFTPISAMIPNIVSANGLFATQRIWQQTEGEDCFLCKHKNTSPMSWQTRRTLWVEPHTHAL